MREGVTSHEMDTRMRTKGGRKKKGRWKSEIYIYIYTSLVGLNSQELRISRALLRSSWYKFSNKSRLLFYFGSNKPRILFRIVSLYRLNNDNVKIKLYYVILYFPPSPPLFHKIPSDLVKMSYGVDNIGSKKKIYRQLKIEKSF